MGSERLRQPAGDLAHEVGRAAVEPIDPPREVQRPLDLPNLIMPVGWQDARRVANGHPSDRYHGARLKARAQVDCWWFVCPRLNRKVRKLYLPLGGRHFWSRRAYRLAYASQRETKYDRAIRRARKVYLRLGGDPADDEYPDKPKRMRWTTYNRLMDKLVAADEVVDERLAPLLARWLEES